MKQQFGDKRRSEIVINTQDLSMEDLIASEDVVVTLSHNGYIKSQPPITTARRRGVGAESRQQAQKKMILSTISSLPIRMTIFCAFPAVGGFTG